MKNLAIIPARSGSKGLKNKNIKMLNGKPLMWYSIDASKKSNLFDEIMVSTDSEEYAKIARECGASVPFLRSEKNSLDTASSIDAIKEVLYKYYERGKTFSTYCLLQPTSPLRTDVDIINAYDMLIKLNADAITSVCIVDHPIDWTMTLDESKSLNEFRKIDKKVARQKLQKYYRLNGAIYISTLTYDKNEIIINNKKEYAYIMDRENGRRYSA